MSVHSVAARAETGPCETIVNPAAARLRPFVAGYAGFRARPLGVLRRRALPVNHAMVIIDFVGPERHVTGPRNAAEVYEQTGRRCGVAIQLTPAGVSALLGLPMRELTGAVPLEDVLGGRAGPLADRLREAPDWASRFALLDDRLSAWLDPGRSPEDPVTYAWRRLEESAGRISIGGLADEIGVSRRYLEIGFQRQIGLAPKTA